MNNIYLEIEATFYRTACYIHDLKLSPDELKADRNLYNMLATAAYDFFEAVALRSFANTRSIALSGCDFDEICNDVTMHYLDKFHRLWESSSPEYYMASVMTQAHRKVLDLVQKQKPHPTLSMEDTDFFLRDSCNIQQDFELAEDINHLISLLIDRFHGMDSIYFLARFALNIKPKSLADELMTHTPKEVAAAVLKTCARQTMIHPSLLKEIAKEVIKEDPVFNDVSPNLLSEYISDRIYETKRYLKKAMARSTTASF